MLILAVESSAAPSSCALLRDGVIIADMRTNVKLTHSQTLMPMVEKMLKITNTDVGDIDVFAVSHGPGSFTGIRIGIAAVKGMALSYSKLTIYHILAVLSVLLWMHAANKYIARCSNIKVISLSD